MSMKKIYQLSNNARQFIVGRLEFNKVIIDGEVHNVPKFIKVGAINVLPATRKRILKFKKRRRSVPSVPRDLLFSRRSKNSNLSSLQIQEDNGNSIDPTLSTFRQV